MDPFNVATFEPKHQQKFYGAKAILKFYPVTETHKVSREKKPTRRSVPASTTMRLINKSVSLKV